MTTAAAWITAAVFCGLWYGRPTMVMVVETQLASKPADTRKVEQPVDSETPVVDQHGVADQAPAPRMESSPVVQPVPRFEFDDIGRKRVSLVGTFSTSDHDLPSASATDGNQAQRERATYAELMREYLPHSSELPHGVSSPLQSVDTGDRT
jgi:hypothetical protein